MPSFRDVKASRIAFHQAELELIQSRASALEGEFADARDAISRAQQLADMMAQDLDALHHRQSAVLADIGALQCQVDPQIMASFPAELLRAIFFSLASILDDGLRIFEGTRIRSCDSERARLPFDLSAVSRRWRQVALDSPSLWGSYLAFGAEMQAGPPRRSVQLYADTVLTYSKSSPLDISFDYGDVESVWEDYRPVLEPCLRLIGSAAQRWRSVFFNFPYAHEVVQGYLDMFRCATPLLEELTTNFDSNDTPNPWRHNFPSYLPFAPKLRDLRTDQCHILWTTAQPVRSSVTELRLHSVDLAPEIVWNILQACPFLKLLFLAVVEGDFSWRPPPAAELCLPDLHQLELYNCGDALFASWSQFLRLPSLNILDLGRIVKTHLTSLLARIGSGPTTLKLQIISQLDADAFDCLSALSELQTIEFEPWRSGNTTEFFNRWASQRGWPRVVNIFFASDTELSSEAADSLLRLIHARKFPTSDSNAEVLPIRSVHFDLPSDPRPVIPVWLVDQCNRPMEKPWQDAEASHVLFFSLP